MGGFGLSAVPSDPIPEFAITQARVVLAAMRPHRLVDERREAAGLVPEHAGDEGRVRVGVDEDSPDIEKHGARTALGVHAFRSFWYCEDPTSGP